MGKRDYEKEFSEFGKIVEAKLDYFTTKKKKLDDRERELNERENELDEYEKFLKSAEDFLSKTFETIKNIEL